jgi:MFS family permease
MTTGLFTLAASLIWAVNTIFLLQRGGLSILQVMLVNTAFTASQLIFEVPTGVIADTVGRRVSYLLSIGTLIVSTLLYVAIPLLGWGVWGFVFASGLLGLGFTFQSGAVDAWLVDALEDTGWAGSKDRAFAWGQSAFAAAMLIGSVLGGVLGQADLMIPYIVRAGALVATFIVVWALVRDVGFKPRPLRWSCFATESTRVLSVGVKYGWGSPVLRPMLFVSLLGGVFFMYGFYSWQPYVLELLGRNYVWLLGLAQAAFSLAMIAGNQLVGRVRALRPGNIGAARTLAATSVAGMVVVACVGAVGVVMHIPSIAAASVAIALWVAWGVITGVSGPVRSGLINEHIPSAERATVLSLDSLFGNAGGSIGQPTLGYLSEHVSISAGWLVGALLVGAAAPLYRRAESAFDNLSEDAGENA